MIKKTVYIILPVLLILGFLLTPENQSSAMNNAPSTQIQQPDNVDPELLDVLSREGSSDYVVEISEQADLSAAYAMTDWDERGWYVYETLKETAERSQLPVISYLEESSLSYQSFFAGNEVMVFGGALRSIETLAALPGVAWIRAPRTATIEPLQKDRTIVTDAEIQSLAWGITYAGADGFWSSFGFQGEGILVANIDTGVQWDHPALDQSYKCGSDPTDPACWEDPSDICGAAGACDNNGHGTHTMGTMVGDDDPSLTYQAGMAPNAQWIACKGCEGQTCSNFALNTCADWILAPDGNPSNRPHIVNNSWGGGGGDAWYQGKVQAWVAASIFPAFSAGNDGPSCNTIGSPGDYQESFASGSHDSGGTIASGSSRGPSSFGHDPYTKPNIAAPGVAVCSTIPTDGWTCGYSGTSMASPHSAGAVALLWSCNPALIGDMTTTFELLQDNAGTAPAGTCGAPPDGEGNYTYGYGYLDVYQAGLTTCSTASTGTLEGYVYDQVMNPIEGASVTSLTSTTTNASGFYSMTVPVGTYTVTANKNGYSSDEVTGVEILEGMTTVQDFQLFYIGDWQDGPAACFDWTRFDTEFFPGTGLIYALGGRSGETTDSTIYSYNPATGECLDTGTDMPTPISNYTINLVNDGSDDLLCTFGGRDSSTNSTQDVQCYDPISNSASVVAALPSGYTSYTVGANLVYNNQVYLFGGFRTTTAPYELARTDRYDPVTQTFTQLGDLSLSRSYIYAAVVDGQIYAIGGTKFDGTNLVPQTLAEVMASPEGAGTWNDSAVTDLPSAYAEGRAQGFDTASGFSDVAGKVVFTGGGQWPGHTADVWTYDPSSDTYDMGFPDLQYARRNHADAFVPMTSSDPNDGLPGLWVFGGYAGTDTPPYAGVEYYPLAAGEEGLIADPLSFDVTMDVGDPPHEETLTLINIGGSPQDFSILEIDQGYAPLNLPAEPNPHAHVEEGTVVLSVSDFGSAEFSVEPESAFPDADVTLEIDDGSIESAIGIGGTLEFIWLNRFTPNPADFPFILNEIQVYFSSDVSVGDDIVLVVYENTSGNADPSIGDNFLYKLPVTVQTLDAWNNYALPAGVSLNGPGDVLIGVIAMETPGSAYYPAALDHTTTQGRSWVGWWTTSPPPSTPSLPPDSDWMLINDAALPGNWMVRGVGTQGEDVLWLSEDPVSGTVAVGDSQEVTITFNAAGLIPGDYQATMSIINSPNSPIQIPVTLHINAEVELIKLFLPMIMK